MSDHDFDPLPGDDVCAHRPIIEDGSRYGTLGPVCELFEEDHQ